MKIKELKKEDLETISFDDLAYMILSENEKKMKIQPLFKKVCSILKLSDQEFEDKIGDFFEVLSTDKRFIMLSNGYWDLRINHSQKIVVIDDEEDDIAMEVIDDEEEDEDEDDISFDEEETEDDTDDELKDLVVIDPENEETEEL